jgi:SAM-dependent methyltransferase
MNILGRTTHKRIISIIIILLLVLMFLWFIKKKKNDDEGFTQELPFILKEGDDIFDDFYAQIYDIIHKPNLYVDSITDDIIKNTNINEDKCVSLVIAGDTGEQSNSFRSKGIDTYTIFKHIDMYDHSLIKYPDMKAKVDDTENPMTYEKMTFSHILCSGMTLYTIQDKENFFRNVYTWLIPDGIFLLQLSDRSKFNTISPSINNELIDTPQKYHNERITDSEIDFGSFRYISKYDFSDVESKDEVYFSETFTDSRTQYVRKQDQTFYMENIDDILKMTLKCGFAVLSKITLTQDENKFIFILERKH